MLTRLKRNKIIQFYLIFLIFIITLSLVFYLKSLNDGVVEYHVEEKEKIHITYIHFYDTNETVTAENLKYFLYFAYKPCKENVDFKFLFTSDKLKNIKDYDELIKYLKKMISNDFIYGNLINCSRLDNILSNTELIIVPNSEDLCVYSSYVNSLSFKLDEYKYKYFFYINSSVRGPFLPVYWIREW
jgi:hypothetical protein